MKILIILLVVGFIMFSLVTAYTIWTINISLKCIKQKTETIEKICIKLLKEHQNYNYIIDQIQNKKQ